MDEASRLPADDADPTGAGAQTGSIEGSTAQPGEAPPSTIGTALRAARAARDLSLDDIAERTKVRPGILIDIEADAHEKLPALTYTLGFVKAYARTVGMDPAQAAERYRRESRKGDPVPTMVDMQPLEAQRLPSKRLITVSTTALVLALALFWAWGAGWLTPEAPPVPVTPAATPAMAPAAAPAPAPAPSEGPVTLTATDEVWLRIADAQETFFMGTLAKGQTLTLPPGRQWTLRTGRAGALQVRVGGIAVPPLGGPAETVRNLSLVPADLLARRAPAAPGLQPAVPVPGIAGPAASSA